MAIGSLVVGLGAMAPASPALAGGSMGYPANFPDHTLTAGECVYREVWQNPSNPSFAGQFIIAELTKAGGKTKLSTVKNASKVVGCEKLDAWFPELEPPV